MSISWLIFNRVIFNVLETLRALYLGDNDFETIPSEIGQLKNLQIVSKLLYFVKVKAFIK